MLRTGRAHARQEGGPVSEPLPAAGTPWPSTSCVTRGGPSGSQSGKGTVQPRKDGPSRKLSKTSKMLFSLCKTLTLRMQRPASPRVAPSDRGRRASHPQRTRKVLWKTSEGLDVAPRETRPGGRSVLTLPRAHPGPPCRTSCSSPLLGPCPLRAQWTLATGTARKSPSPGVSRPGRTP